MPIETSTFGGVTLNGSAAEAFRKQFIDNPPKQNKAAEESLRRGKKMLEEFNKFGYVTVRVAR